MKKPNKEQMDSFVSKIEEARKKVDEGAQSKIMPLVRGYEGVIILVLAVIILVSLSLKALILGALVAAVLMLPSYYPKIMAKLSKSESDVTVVSEVKPEAEVKEPEVIEVKTEEKK